MPPKEEKLVVHYRWEFLRRNPDFRREIDSFIEKFSQWFNERGWWYDPESKYGKEESTYLKSVIGPESRTIQRRWNLGRIYPYSWSFDQSGKYELRPGVVIDLASESVSGISRGMKEIDGDVVRLSVDSLLWEYENRTGDFDHDNVAVIPIEDVPDYVIEDLSIDHERDLDKRVYFAVNISFPLESSIAKLEAEIRKARLEYKEKYGKFSRTELRPRRRFDEYKSYLQVWDLKEKGLSHAKVVEILPHLNNVDTVKDHFRRAKQLVMGGYRQIK